MELFHPVTSFLPAAPVFRSDGPVTLERVPPVAALLEDGG